VRLRVGRVSPSVRVQCTELPNRESVSTVFHLDMPMEATVDDLRRVLGSRLPEWAEVYARRPGRVRASLKDAEPLPDKVMVSDFASAVTADMLLTKSQVQAFQEVLLEHMQSARIQRQLNVFEEEAGGDDGKYRAKLGFLLMDEVYPVVAADFGLPRTYSCMRALIQTVTVHMREDAEMFVLAMKLEAALRNWQMFDRNKLSTRDILIRRDMPQEQAERVAEEAARCARASATAVRARAEG